MTQRERWDDFWLAYSLGAWEQDTRLLLKEMLEPGDLFLDVGAWIGPVTLWALELGAEVIAVEPDPEAREEFLRNVPLGDVELWDGAITTGGGDVTLEPGRRGYGDSMSKIGPNSELVVKSWTVQEVLGDRKPDLIKMDIEGYELSLLPSFVPAVEPAPMVVSLHDGVPDPKIFDGYSSVSVPASARDERGRSNTLVARG